MSDSVFSDILAAFFVICLIAWWNDWPPVSNNEVATYNAVCYFDHECKASELILSRTIYRADAGSQTVTIWGNEDDREISLYHRCAIKNKKNWVCATDKDGPIWAPQMHDGIVSESTQTSWYRWWWLKVNAYFEKK
jgi:hypothetical protein